MHLTIHGHFYQPPRENPWTGWIPRQEDASPHHDWNARIASECYAPNARSRILDERGRIEEIVNNYEWIHFDFGPTLLRWLEKAEPQVYREILAADRRSRARCGGHGNAIAQAYNHMILPLATHRDKRTQVLWGLRDFEYRFGRPSESIWLPETAIDLETLRLLVESGMRYVILAPRQAKRIRSLGGGPWTDVSGGRIDPRRPYRALLRGADGKRQSLDVFFYDGPISVAISFEHLLQNASGLADRLQAATKGGGPDAFVHAATDGEVYGHHEPFGDMCLAYLVAREGPLRGITFTNYGAYLDTHPPQHEVEIDFGEEGEGTSWSCSHGVGRWRRDCGCATGGRPAWNQKWRTPLRRGLDHLRDRLLETYLTCAGDLVRDPGLARDEYIDVLLDPPAGREKFLAKHARKELSPDERRRLWRLLESQHHGMLMFTSCAWFFADIAGLEARQNFAYAARAIELAQPFCRDDLEEGLLNFLAEARSNVPEIRSGAEVWRRFVRPMRRRAQAVALEAAGLLASGRTAEQAASPAFSVQVDSVEGSLPAGGLSAALVVRDEGTEEAFPFLVEARHDAESLMLLRVVREGGTAEGREGAGDDRRGAECTVDDLSPEVRSEIVRALLADLLEREQARFDEIFETSRPLIERNRDQGMILPPIFHALAADVIARRCDRAAGMLSAVPQRELTGELVARAIAEVAPIASQVGISPPLDPIGCVIEGALAANLANVKESGTADLQRCLDLIRAADEGGVKIQRTRLEEMVYALLNHHREVLAARLAGVTVPDAGIDPDVLIRLAEQSNLSLRTFEKAPVRSD